MDGLKAGRFEWLRGGDLAQPCIPEKPHQYSALAALFIAHDITRHYKSTSSAKSKKGGIGYDL
jgi:hypothetical protein